MGDRNSKVPGFEFRKGIDSFPDFRGMNRQDDPGAIPQDQFYLLQNARVKGSEIISRGGLSAGVDIGTASGIIDNLEQELSGFLWSGAGASPNLFNITPDDTLNELTTTGVQNPACFTRYSVDGYLYVSGFSGFGTSYLYKTNGARFANDIVEQVTSYVPGGSSAVPVSIISYNSRVYIGEQDTGAANPTIRYWNGSSLTLEDTSTVIQQGPVLVEDHNGELLCAWQTQGGGAGTEATSIRRRNNGTWSNVAVPGSLGGGFNCITAVVYSGATYFCGYATGTVKGVILKWDGSVLTKVVGLFADNTPIVGLAVLGSNLYYYWGDASSAKIGMFNGVTWTDSYKDLNAQFSGMPVVVFSGQLLGGLMANSTNLYVVGSRGTLDFADIYKSPLTVLSGTWTKVASSATFGDVPLVNGRFSYIAL